MSLTNAQAALMAATQQLPPTQSYNVPGPTGEMISVDLPTATKTMAALYLTWLDRQDEIEARLKSDSVVADR